MLVYAERLPSSPAELSATVRIAAKLAEKLEAVVDDYFAALHAVGFDDGHIHRDCAASRPQHGIANTS